MASRLVFTEFRATLGGTDAAGFLDRALAFFAASGIRVERVLSDNGSAYRSFAFRDACRSAGIQIGTKVWLYDTNAGAVCQLVDNPGKTIKVSFEALGIAPTVFDNAQRLGDTPCGPTRGCVQIGVSGPGQKGSIEKDFAYVIAVDRDTFQIVSYAYSLTYADPNNPQVVPPTYKLASTFSRYNETFDIKPPQ